MSTEPRFVECPACDGFGQSRESPCRPCRACQGVGGIVHPAIELVRGDFPGSVKSIRISTRDPQGRIQTAIFPVTI